MPKHTPSVALLLSATLAAGADAGQRPLRPVADCLDPARVRTWSATNDSQVIIDAGRRQYVVELAHGCPELGVNPFLGFISHNPSGRICGDIGDRLVPHGSARSGRPHCAIRQIRLAEKVADPSAPTAGPAGP